MVHSHLKNLMDITKKVMKVNLLLNIVLINLKLKIIEQLKKQFYIEKKKTVLQGHLNIYVLIQKLVEQSLQL